MTTTEERKLTLTIDVSLSEQIEQAAAREGIAVERYCVQAIEGELAKDGHTFPVGEPTGKRRISDIIAWRNETFGDRVFARDSVDYIRETREIRNVQMDAWRKPTL
ncbi:MAG: hypothetical protein OXN86_13490 [Chloroflexota bacterium]|nr:hypothetical protein [Chloroflexota bacterium]